MSESCENYLIVLCSEEGDVSNPNDFSEKRILDLLTDAVRIKDESQETEVRINDVGKNNFLQTTQSEPKQVCTKQTHLRSQDVASVGKSVASNTNLCNSVNFDSMPKKEECVKDEGKGDLSLTNHSVLFPFDDAPDTEDNRSFQTTLLREEFNEKCGNEWDSVVKGSSETKPCCVDLQRPINHSSSSGARFPDVSVVPKDSFPRLKGDSQESAQGHVNSRVCQITTKCKPQSKIENFVEMNVLRKSTESRKNLGNCNSEKSAVDSVCGKWNSCTLCPARFRFMHCLKRHAAVDHDVHLCSECPSTFQHRSDLQTHLKMHSARKQYCCVFCSFRCQVEAELKVHSRAHSNEKFFSCAECHLEFDKSHALLDHVQEHANRELFSCLRCPARFDDAAGLMQHSAVHSNEKLVLSDHSAMEQKSLLNNKARGQYPHHSIHYTVMQPITPASHDHCYAELRGSSEMEHHLQTYTASGQDVAVKMTDEAEVLSSCADNISSTRFPCSKCDAKFMSERGLKVHMTRSHVYERPHACKKCTNALALRPRASGHFKEGLLVCAYCGVEFQHKSRFKCVCCDQFCSMYSSLAKHERFYCTADENTRMKNRLSCNYCEKTFFFVETFKLHLQTHTLPYKCQECGKAFSRQWSLKGHIRTHTGEKPFSCPYCNRAFADRSNLRTHLVTHGTGKRYFCGTCSKSFSRIIGLANHWCEGSPGPILQDDPSAQTDDKELRQLFV